MKKINYLFLVLFAFYMASCETQKKEEKKEEKEVKKEYVDELGDVVRGFDSIKALVASLIIALDNKDYKEYLSHTMTKEMEMEQAEMLQDSSLRKMFIHEYGFSLREEKHYFDFTIKYFDEHGVNVADANLEEIEYIPYKVDRYKPLEMYEVFVPIEGAEYPETIDIVVIKLDGKYYMTSEIGI